MPLLTSNVICNKNMKPLVLIMFLILITSFNINAANLYQENYDKFWEEWKASQQLLVACKASINTSAFIVNALSYSGNAEVFEANAKEIEKLAINNPACLVNGLAELTEVQLTRFYNLFIKRAIFHNSNEIIASIKKNGEISKFPNVQELFK